MALLTTRNMTEGDGTALTFSSAAGGGDTYAWSEDTFLLVQNDSGGSITVTIVPTLASKTEQGYGTFTKATITKAIAAGARALIDTRSKAFQGTDGNVSVSYSGVTSLTVAAVRLGQL
jgi:hypothetical protein